MKAGRRVWMPRVGWVVVLVLLAFFVWGLERRARLAAGGEQAVRMLFVPSVEQGTLVRRGDELARFIRADCGLTLTSRVPTSYAAVVQALGTGQADVAWVPVFAYVLAHARSGVEARLQVVRSVERTAIVVARSSTGEPEDLAGMAGRRVAVPVDLPAPLRTMVVDALDRQAPGWTEIRAGTDKAAVLALVDRQVDGAASSHVVSGPEDLVGDGRKELEYDRPGTLRDTRVVFETPGAASEPSTVYYGGIFTRTDSGIRRLEDLSGRSFAFSDETSTSGHIFPRVLLGRAGVTLGHVLFAGGHPNVIQAVREGKVAAGAAFYSPPSEENQRDGTMVADARMILIKNMPTQEERRRFLEQVRIIALTDPIPNDVCCVRRGFPEAVWERFESSLQRFLATPDGQSAFYDLVAGVAAAPTTDAAFDPFRAALRESGVTASRLLDSAEAGLRRKRQQEGGGGDR